jgi:hypothetical protein
MTPLVLALETGRPTSAEEDSAIASQWLKDPGLRVLVLSRTVSEGGLNRDDWSPRCTVRTRAQLCW